MKPPMLIGIHEWQKFCEEYGAVALIPDAICSSQFIMRRELTRISNSTNFKHFVTLGPTINHGRYEMFDIFQTWRPEGPWAYVQTPDYDPVTNKSSTVFRLYFTSEEDAVVFKMKFSSYNYGI